MEVKYLLKFGKEEYVKEFAEGILYCSNAETFWDIEDKKKLKGQGDILEGSMRIFSQQMLIQSRASDEAYYTNAPGNILMRVAPIKTNPVFCMFAVTRANRNEGNEGLKLPDNIKKTIRSHFPEADTVAVIKHPDEFIEDIKNSIGHRIEYDTVKYFNMSEGLPVEGSDETAMDFQLMQYLTDGIIPESVQLPSGKAKKYTVTVETAYRMLFCKDVFFKDEQEYRIVLPEVSIQKGTKFPVKLSEKISLYPLEEFFEAV